MVDVCELDVDALNTGHVYIERTLRENRVIGVFWLRSLKWMHAHIWQDVTRCWLLGVEL
jgi:hypothetical protein